MIADGQPVTLVSEQGRVMAEGKVGEWTAVMEPGMAKTIAVDLPDGSLLVVDYPSRAGRSAESTGSEFRLEP